MKWIAGVDGFKARWFVVLRNLDTGEFRTRIVSTFSDLTNLTEQPIAVAVDIPIGLPDFARQGGRSCEREARKILRSRASCVFSAVGRRALNAKSREEADRWSRDAGGTGVGAQAWGLAKKLKEVDAVMTPDHQEFVREVHPEVSFWKMNGCLPLLPPKKTVEGVRVRTAAIEAHLSPGSFVRDTLATLCVGRDDFLDACAALWTAQRIAEGHAERFPDLEDRDARGLDQAIWF